MAPRADNRFQMPATINPANRVCVTIDVPDDPTHWANFWGALDELAQGRSYFEGGPGTVKQVIQVWRDVLLSVKLDTCQPVPISSHGMEVDLGSPLRIDCDCNVWITCCDGTEKQILTADQVNKLLAGSVVAGAPQPAPGTCQVYPLTISDGEHVLVPTPVNTGDTLEAPSPGGASLDTAYTFWRCANGGLVFFAGDCAGAPQFDTAALVPSAPVGTLVVLLNAVWYSLASGVFTVPAGVTNLQPVLALNYPVGAVIYGDVSVGLIVCNHGTVTTRWTHTFDFKAAAGPFTPAFRAAFPTVPLAVWVPGTGWTSVFNADGSSFNEIRMYVTGLPSTGYDTCSDIWTDAVNIDENAAGPGSGTAFTVNFNLTPLTAGTNVHSTATATPYTATSFRIDIVDLSTHASHTISLSSLTISGMGVDPF